MSYRADDLENLCAFNKRKKKVFITMTLGFLENLHATLFTTSFTSSDLQVHQHQRRTKGAARYHFTAFGIIPRVRIIIIHYIGLEILRTDNSSLPARRLIISFFNNR